MNKSAVGGDPGWQRGTGVELQHGLVGSKEITLERKKFIMCSWF